MIKDIPSNLGYHLDNSNIEAALLPIFEVLKRKDLYVIDGISIACHNKAGSVILILNKEIKSVKSIGLDNSSLSSINLLKLLTADYYKIKCNFILDNPQNLIKNKDNYDAYLLIGDNAIKHHYNKYIDLGEAWNNWTGLPFVFAVWASKTKNLSIKNDLLNSKKLGLNNIDKIINDKIINQHQYNNNFLQQYFKSYLHYELDYYEKQAVYLYQKMLYNKKLLNNINQIKLY